MVPTQLRSDRSERGPPVGRAQDVSGVSRPSVGSTIFAEFLDKDPESESRSSECEMMTADPPTFEVYSHGAFRRTGINPGIVIVGHTVPQVYKYNDNT